MFYLEHDIWSLVKYDINLLSILDEISGYTAPELRQGFEASYASDVYAMGITILESLTDETRDKNSSPDMGSLTGDNHKLVSQCVENIPEKRIKSGHLARSISRMC